MKRVIIYGIGYNFTIFCKYAIIPDIKIIAYVDKYKAGQVVMGKQILSPEEITTLDYDEIFMLNCRNREEIKDSLCREQRVARESIRDVCYVNENYMLRDLEKYKYVYFSLPSEFENVPFESMSGQKDVAVRAVLSSGGDLKITETSDKEIFFLFRSISYYQHYTERFYDYIKDKYPNGKRIMYLNDMCRGDYAMSGVFGDDFFSVEYLKEQFDLIITYHPVEAKRYQFVWFRHPYWKMPLEPVEITTDVFFTGRAKDRLDMIHDVFLKLSNSGLKCEFRVLDVDEESQLKGYEGITYNKLTSYTEYLHEMNRSKCILEVCQRNDITTLRFAEAVAFNKLLLVNEDFCKSSKYYNPDYICCFKEAQEIDTDWVKQEKIVDYHYQEEDFSAAAILRVIDDFFG